MNAQRGILLTPQEYLEMERAADFKSEYFAGEIYAMAGASPRHTLIVTNTVCHARWTTARQTVLHLFQRSAAARFARRTLYVS